MACAQAVSLASPAFRSVPFVELRQSVPSQIAIIPPFVDQLMHFIARLRNPDGSELNIETALHEALANAIMHGNQEDPRKLVCVACRGTGPDNSGESAAPARARDLSDENVNGRGLFRAGRRSCVHA